jgi:hypothetical protein
MLRCMGLLWVCLVCEEGSESTALLKEEFPLVVEWDLSEVISGV